MSKGNVLITGASSGIGYACAVRLASLGFQVFAGVRKPEDGDKLRPHATPVRLDLTDGASIRSGVQELGDGPLAALINNAGIAIGGPVELVPIDLWRLQMEVNVIGLVAVTQAVLPQLRRAQGRVINIGSIAGRSAVPCMGPYSASKFAVEAISDTLRMELAAWNVHVALLEPGPVKTPIWEKSLQMAQEMTARVPAELGALYAAMISKIRKGAELSQSGGIEVAEVVKAVEHALLDPKPRTRYVVGAEARQRAIFNILPDRWKDHVILKKIESFQ